MTHKHEWIFREEYNEHKDDVKCNSESTLYTGRFCIILPGDPSHYNTFARFICNCGLVKRVKL